MATEEIALKLTTDSGQAEKSVKSIKTELREATQEALNLAQSLVIYHQRRWKLLKR